MNHRHRTPERRIRRGLPRLALVALLAAAACGRGAEATRDDALLTTSEGDVAPATVTGTGLAYTITSQDYRKWMQAEGALASIGRDELSTRIPLETATEDDVARVTAELEANERVRSAIERAGLSVEEYVRMTVALEQAMAASDPDAGVRLRSVPAENIIIADRYRHDLERVRSDSPLRVERDGRRADEDGKKREKREKREKRGRGKDKGRGRG